MDYEPLFKLPTGVDDIESVFMTGRGSTYAHHTDSTTTRNRSGAQHRDTRTGIQPRSGKTVFMDPSDVSRLGGLFQNTELATRFVPVLDKDGKPTGKAKLELLEDYGPRKAGTSLLEVPYSLKPVVGLNPVEIYNSASPMGDSGRGIHFGNKITEVHPKPARLGGKLGVAAALASGAGSASAGELKQAAGEVAEAFLPIGLTPSGLAPGTLPPEIKAEQERVARMSPQQRDEYYKALNQKTYAAGGPIRTPDGTRLI